MPWTSPARHLGQPVGRGTAEPILSGGPEKATNEMQPMTSVGVAFRAYGKGILVRTPSARHAAEIARVLPAYACPPESAEPAEVWQVSEDDDGILVEPQHVAGDRFPSLGAAMDAIEYMVTIRLLVLHEHKPHVHAAGAVVDGGAMLAIGESGAGKSSIGFQWSAAGVPVLGDDIVPLDHEGRALPFKRLFTVHRDRFAAAGMTPDPALEWSPDPDDEARFDPASCGGWGTEAPVVTVARIRRTAGADLRVEELAKPEALTVLVGALMREGAPAERCFDVLLRIINHARTVSVTCDDTARMARVLADGL